MKFKYSEYDQYFRERFCEEGECLSKYAALFDLREPAGIKRPELSPQKYKQAWDALENKHGRVCQLQYCKECEINNPTVIDHVIPLSSNVLNKESRKSLPISPGKKVAAESFGSNDISNLVLACTKCNANKKHRFLDRDAMRRILQSKGF